MTDPRRLGIVFVLAASPWVILATAVGEEWWDVPIPTPMSRDQLIPSHEGHDRVEQQRLSFDYEASLDSSLAVDLPVPPALAARRAERATAEGAVATVTRMQDLIADRDVAIALGKALFWEMRAGSDGQTACATCHYDAGIDARRAPDGSLRRASLGVARRALAGGPSPAQDVEASVAWTARLAGQLCVREWGAQAASRCEVPLSPPPASGAPQDQPIGERCERGGGPRTRMETCKNAPTVIGAVAFDRLFHDAAARSVFNGYDELGDDALPDPIGIWRSDGGRFERVLVRLEGSALASQATRPILAPGEMSWEGRRFYHLARKLLDTVPLREQAISPEDQVLMSVLGGGRRPTYRDLIQRAFKPQWTSERVGRVRPAIRNTLDGRRLELTQMEANFALYWGVAIQLYEETLVPGDTPFDRYYLALNRGEPYTGADFPQAARDGFHAFQAAGCELCHLMPEFSSAARSHLYGPLAEFEAPDDYFGPPESNEFVDWLLAGRPWTPMLVEGMNIPLLPEHPTTAGLSPKKIVTYDNGFYNIGIAPERLAPGLGADLSRYVSRAERSRPRSLAIVQDPTEMNNYGAGGVSTDAPLDAHRTWILGATKSPSLRNVALTAPYYSDVSIGAEDLHTAVALYRGMPFASSNAHLHPELRDMDFRNADVDAMVAFLHTLTDERVVEGRGPFSSPSIRLPERAQTSPSGATPQDGLRCVPASPAVAGAPLGCGEVCNGLDDDGNGRIDDGTGVCTDPVRQFGGHSYLFSSARALNFDEALAWCGSQGYDLVTPSSAAENDWLWDTAWNATDNQGLLNTEAWIGLVAEGGVLRWANGETVGFTALLEAVPNDPRRQAAYTAFATTPVSWKFNPTGASKRVICESR